MAKTDDRGKQDRDEREERLERIRGRVASNGEDASKVLKMWMDKEADAKARR